MVKKLYDKIPTFLKNKYSLSVLFFIVWISFIDQNDMISRYHSYRQLKDLYAERKYYVDEIEKNKNDLHELMASPESLEKYARERYLMKKDNEDVFVFVH